MIFAWRRVHSVLVIGGIFLCLLIVAAALYAYSFRERVLPGVYLSDIPIGGSSRDELRRLLDDRINNLFRQSMRITYVHSTGKEVFELPPLLVTDDVPKELVAIDISAAVESLMHYGKDENFILSIIRPFMTSVIQPVVSLEKNVSIDRETLRLLLRERLASFEQPPRDAQFIFLSFDPLRYDVIPALHGVVYNYDFALDRISYAWSHLVPVDIRMERVETDPVIRESDISSLIPYLNPFFDQFPILLSYTDPENEKETRWTIDKGMVADWLRPIRGTAKEMWLGLDEEKINKFLTTTVEPVVEVEAQDAKFEIDPVTHRAVQFQSARSGRSIDRNALFVVMSSLVQREIPATTTERISIVMPTITVEPKISTAETNSLGISDIVGVGISNFSGSPINRRKNIENAVEKLNGILIPPGEIFSTLSSTAPFTDVAGYLPELVIKGNSLKPEIGGGLCQIGTTLFRMAMNSGLPIVERRNHSLVVQYYGDVRNGLPGTDATVYDPVPDFRFQNDTGRHLLLQTAIDEDRDNLVFTLWGTHDGRSASYTAPIVTRWIPYDQNPTIVETQSLSPGERRCQHPFQGAEASFVYRRSLPDGRVEEQLFKSYYRPLPEICLVGASQTTTGTPTVDTTLIQ